MGFDLSGLKPVSETGKCFRNNVWWWCPLATFVLRVCDVPEEEAKDWDTNDGQRVTQETAVHIADRLQELVESGEVKKYEEETSKWLESLPDTECDFCEGTGQRDDKFAQGQCNACKGKGMKRPWVTLYPFDEENVVDFIAFCRDSGGFVIW